MDHSFRMFLAALSVTALLGTGSAPIAQAKQPLYDDCEKLEGERGIDACTRFIKEQGDDFLDPYPYMYRGLKYMDLRDYDRALADLSIAAKSGVDPAFNYYRGQVYQLKDDHKSAIPDITKFLDKKPDHAEARLRRGLSYEYLEQYDKAIDDYDKSIAGVKAIATAKPNSLEAELLAKAQNFRGRAQAAKGCFVASGDIAIEGCSELIKRSPQNARAYFARAVEYESKRDYDRALADYGKAIELDPTRAQYYAGRGDMYSSKGDYDQAMADFEKAIGLAPLRAASYGGRGGVWFGRKEFANALSDYSKNIELDPRDAGARYNRGLTYEKLGRREEAIADYKGALAIKANHANSLKALERLGVK